MKKKFDLYFYESGDEYKLSLTEVREALDCCLGSEVVCPAELKGTELIVDLRPALKKGAEYCDEACERAEWVKAGFNGNMPKCSCNE